MAEKDSIHEHLGCGLHARRFDKNETFQRSVEKFYCCIAFTVYKKSMIIHILFSHNLICWFSRD